MLSAAAAGPAAVMLASRVWNDEAAAPEPALSVFGHIRRRKTAVYAISPAALARGYPRTARKPPPRGHSAPLVFAP